jgi:beta-N-acetylhexosaminidase
VTASILGYQSAGLACAAKHFPGHGRSTTDSHAVLPTVDIATEVWRETDALPFTAAVFAEVDAVMLGHLRYPRWDDAPASLSPVAVRVLRDELGFSGLVVTDALGMGALAHLDPYEVVDRALAAGVDLLLYATPPVPFRSLVEHVCRRLHDGAISAERLETSVRRVLRLKAKYGLVPTAPPASAAPAEFSPHSE